MLERRDPLPSAIPHSFTAPLPGACPPSPEYTDISPSPAAICTPASPSPARCVLAHASLHPLPSPPQHALAGRAGVSLQTEQGARTPCSSQDGQRQGMSLLPVLGQEPTLLPLLPPGSPQHWLRLVCRWGCSEWGQNVTSALRGSLPRADSWHAGVSQAVGWTPYRRFPVSSSLRQPLVVARNNPAPFPSPFCQRSQGVFQTLMY